MAIKNIGLTVEGKRYNTDCIAKEKPILFRKIVIGEGLIETNYKGEHGVLKPVIEVPIRIEKQGDNKVRIRGTFTNQEIGRGFFYSEIALFVYDEDAKKEILYCYGNEIENPEYIDIPQAVVVEKMIDIILENTNDVLITMTVDTNLYATKEDLKSKADKSITEEVILSVANWRGDKAPYSYSLELAKATETNHIELMPPSNLTVAQRESMTEADIIGGNQSIGSITLLAYGDKPTIDIPIVILVRGD